MFRDSRVALKTFVAALCLLQAGISEAGDAVSSPDCAAGVCVINVLSSSAVGAPCEGDSVLIAYSTRSGATLIQCSNLEDPLQNKIFIYDRRQRNVQPLEFRGGRFVRPAAISQAASEGIPDKFGPVPLCEAPNREWSTNGELLVLEKTPNASDDKPYCYRVHQVRAGKSRVSLLLNGTLETSPVSKKAARKWARLRERLSKYIPNNPDIPQPDGPEK